MAKALATVGKVAGVVAAVTRFIPGAQVISAVATAVALTASLGAQLAAKKPPVLGGTTAITIGADQETPYMIGDTYAGGALVHKIGYGPKVDKVPNPYLAMAIIYSAGGPIAEIDSYYADFEPVTFNGTGEANGFYRDLLFRTTSLGPALQAQALASPFPSAIPGWGATAKLSGKAHVLWGLHWDSKTSKYSGGAPQLGARGRGVLTWDPRADSTRPGGSGPQRWASPADTAAFDAAKATWTYTDRPGLHALRYALGTWERDLNDPASTYQLTFGLGFRLDQVVVEDFVALENLCEQNGWEVSGILYEPGDKAANLKRILHAGGAEIAWKGGRLGLSLSAPRIALDTVRLTDIAEGGARAVGMQPWRSRINTVIPKFRSPDHKWTMQQSTKISDPELVVEDGEEKSREEPFELVKRADQAAQLAAYRMYDDREAGPIEITVLPRLRRYQAGDRLLLEAALVDALGLPHGDVVIAQRQPDPATMTTTFTMVLETAGKHAKALGATGAGPAAIVIPAAGEIAGVVSAANGIARGAYQITAKSIVFPVTTTATTIAVEPFRATLDDGRRIELPAGLIEGLEGAANYRVLYALEDVEIALTGAEGEPLTGPDGPFTSVIMAGTYYAAPMPALDEMGNSAFAAVERRTTAAADGTYPAAEAPPPGYGGDGYGGGGEYQAMLSQA